VLIIKHHAASLNPQTSIPKPQPSTPGTSSRHPIVRLLDKSPLPHPPSPPTPFTPLLQRHNGYIYATAHVHDVDGRDAIKNGLPYVSIDAGFEVAPGDASDIEVANAHAWGSAALVFSDSNWAATAVGIAHLPSNKGNTNALFLNASLRLTLIS
jgi:hypothetical protein